MFQKSFAMKRYFFKKMKGGCKESWVKILF